MGKIGILLINLGTPNDPSVQSVRRYLKEFLLDPRVIDLPVIARYLLVYGVILPFRPKKSAEAYQKIWTKEGSPLRVYGEQLTQKLVKKLGESYQVALGMRYGNPTIAAAVDQLKICDEIIVLPLFPQYAEASTGSAIAKARDVLAKAISSEKTQVNIIEQFYDHPAFIDAMSVNIQPYLKTTETFLLMSYHGLPERQLDKISCNAKCDRQDKCPAMSSKNAQCYRAQCYATSRAIAKKLNLKPQRYTTSFQSRLGRVPWIKPYTDEMLTVLRARDVKHLVIACPAFVADCLETLEEIGLGIKADWLALGGESFELVPCVNADDQWVEGLAELFKSMT